MGRGVSAGGGQSSLGYLFGSGEAPKPSQNNANTTTITTTTTNAAAAVNNVEVVNHTPKCRPASEPVDVSKQIPAGINSSTSSTQNTGNFLTERPSTKVHSAPGGGSSLGYLFGGGGK